MIRAIVTLLAVQVSAWPAQAAPPSFNRDIRPILSNNCFQCHGPDAAVRKAGLRLDRRPSDMDRLGPTLLERVAAHAADDRMPPAETGKRLSADEIDLLRRWIDAGASWDVHWSFVPPRRSEGGSIDAFVQVRLHREGLAPSPPSDRERLLRRVTLDLTGLPPTLEEIDAFLADDRPDAYERVVDRLLASPRFGERMAVPWLDVARYADSYGYQSDQLSPTWPYRDWVVRAFNENLPFDEMIRWQLAGDLLPEPTRPQRLATAFNRLHRMTNEGGSIEQEWRIEYAADRVHTFGTAFLGLTLECARCHDHKFDPISTREYYGLQAFFNSIDEWGMYNDSAHVPTPALLLPTPEQEARLETLEAAVTGARSAYAALATQRDDAFGTWLASFDVPEPALPGRVGRYDFESIGEGGSLTNGARPAASGRTAAANTLAPGWKGKALRFSGDDPASFPGLGLAFEPWEPFTIGFALHVPAGLDDAIVGHRTSGTDVGFFGAELSLRDGRLLFAIIRFWPGNALAVRTRRQVASGRWQHVAIGYDGSGTAAGMTVYLDGEPAPVEVLTDRLTKSPGAGGDGLTLGQRFRDAGLEGGMVDELHVFDRALSPIEVAQLFDGSALDAALSERDESALREYYLAAVDPALADARAARSAAVRELYGVRNGVAEIMVMEEQAEPRDTHVLARGAYDAPRDASTRVRRGTPSVLPPLPEEAPRDRLGLARWLTRPDHPLTARVTGNRLWQMLFGRGLVETSEDFGMQGTYPSHPALLDWLAVEFVESGWDVKAMVRLMVTSATYRQTSACGPELRQRDPDNVLLARGPSARLSAEMVRDLALAASGLLDGTMGGPPVSPYQPAGFWREANSMSPAYRQSVGGGLYRRSLYTVWKRTTPMPNMLAFDAPTREVCRTRRRPTSSPVQALVLLNDPQFVEAARVLAERVLREGGAADHDRVTYAFRLLTGRRPLHAERVLLVELLAGQRAAFSDDADATARLLAVGAREADSRLDAVETAAWTSVTQAILNLDATVWKR